MVVTKKKKGPKFRGSRYHGGGTKKHRGAGNRGGRGMAGSGKRADHKKPSILKEYGPKYFGAFGFNRPARKVKVVKAINIADLPQKSAINLKELGFTKLLGKGSPTMKHDIVVASCSKRAKEKIEKAGGSVKEL
jgi:large subunit ribosomal protein L15|tara:strand:+ start:36468 stop:36869 length:402 start_codon:yes stop_codon:yes gene_type:complete